MSQEKTLFLLGAGGHCKRCLDIFKEVNGIKIGGIFDDNKTGTFFHNYEILDVVDNVRQYLTEDSVVFCTIGDNKTRERICENLKDCVFINCISPLAYISPTAEIGLGNFIGDFSIISSDAKVGSFNIINDGAIFNHDCSMVDYNHISLGVACGGGVACGNGNLVGINAGINPKIRIGNWNIIGSGAVIIRDIENERKIVGVPGRDIGDVNATPGDIRFVIVMATYNRPNGETREALTRCLQSIIDQTYTKWDLIVVSDKYEPFDDLVDILKMLDHLSDNKVYLLNNENPARDSIKPPSLWSIAGANSMNMGMNKARELGYKYQCHMDDDDYWEPTHLSDFFDVFTKYPKCIFSYSKSSYISPPTYPKEVMDIYENNLMLKGGGLIHASACWRIDILKFDYICTPQPNNLEADRVMWDNIKGFIIQNPKYTCVYISNLTCHHDSERGKSIFPDKNSTAITSNSFAISGNFDEDFYRNFYPDINNAILANKIKTGLQHYKGAGYREVRFPNAYFEFECQNNESNSIDAVVDEEYYLSSYPIVRSFLANFPGKASDFYRKYGYQMGHKPSQEIK